MIHNAGKSIKKIYFVRNIYWIHYFRYNEQITSHLPLHAKPSRQYYGIHIIAGDDIIHNSSNAIKKNIFC